MTIRDVLIAIFCTITTLTFIELRRNKSIKDYNNRKRKSSNDLNLLENFSGILGKQYLYLQDNGTYYNRYTYEYMSAEDAEHWLYSELSGIINGGE